MLLLPFVLFADAFKITLQELALMTSQANKINIMLDPKLDVKRNFYFYDDFNPSLSSQSFKIIIESNGYKLKYLGDIYYVTNEDNVTKYDYLKYRNVTSEDVDKLSRFYGFKTISLGHSEMIVQYKDEDKYLSFKTYLEKISSPKHVYLEGEIIAVNETQLNDMGIDFASISSTVIKIGSFDLGLITNVNNNDFVQEIISGRGLTSIGDISTFISFLKETGTSHVVSRPIMLIQDGKESIFKSGQQIRIVDSSTESIRDTGEYSSKQYRMLDVGLSLKCAAQIVEDKASLKFDFVVSDLTEYKPLLDQLIIDNKSYSATFNIVDGEEIVLAGLTSEIKTTSTASLPILSDIPIFGKVFDHDYDTTQKISYLIYFKGIIQ